MLPPSSMPERQPLTSICHLWGQCLHHKNSNRTLGSAIPTSLNPAQVECRYIVDEKNYIQNVCLQWPSDIPSTGYPGGSGGNGLRAFRGARRLPLACQQNGHRAILFRRRPIFMSYESPTHFAVAGFHYIHRNLLCVSSPPPSNVSVFD